VSSPVLHEVDTGAEGIRAVFSGGDLDVGIVGPASPEAVRRNRRRLASAAGFDPQRAVVLRQVHGARAVEVDREGGAGDYSGAMGGVAEADASVTRAAGVALLALGADCAPVLLWSSTGVAVGAVHAGWRGLVAGVIPAAVDAMGVDPMGVNAVVGPCIGPCCYPVDADLRCTMGERFGGDVVKGDAVDLALGVRRSLMQAGLTPEAIRGVAECTACGPGTWFSYRRDGERAGRHAGLIWIEEAE
jgi:polyphenol oxidase